MGTLILSTVFIVVFAAAVTGFLKLALKDHPVLRVLHRACGPLANFLFALYFVLFQFYDSGPIQRVILTASFIILVYSGIVTAKPELEGSARYTHIALGVLSLVALSFVFFTFVLIGTGAVAALNR